MVVMSTPTIFVSRIRAPLRVAAVALAMVAAVAVAAGWGWDPGSAQLPARGVARSSGTKCAECGTVVSAIELQSAGHEGATTGAAAGPLSVMAQPSRRFAVTVRMSDGSSRVFIDSDRTSWRQGQRVIVIEAGADDGV
jgi:hypothetical protein